MLLATLLLALGSATYSHGETVVLYDGSLNTTPDQQGWKYITKDSSAVQSAGEGFTNLDTTANMDMGEQAGYFSKIPLPPYSHPLVPQLDRMAGFTISFSVEIEAEHHGTDDDRAGFSIIVITHDLKGLELGFWTDEIWAQADSPLFTHAEGSTFDTTAGIVPYDLSINGNNYALSAGAATILRGPLRDYAAVAPMKPQYAVYRTPDFLFFGDDTTSASASIKLASISHNDQITDTTGDINGDGTVGLDDAIFALQICADIELSSPIAPPNQSLDADVNEDGTFGLEEVIYILQDVSGLRN
jgi:hypothetical protein